MSADTRLEIAAGFASAKGPRADNQDFGAVHIGPPEEQTLYGVIAAVADGVGGTKAGRMAAELAVRSFIDGYTSQSPLKGIAGGGISALRGYNSWLFSRGRNDPEMKGTATTFTAVVLRGREAVCLHVGDSRAYHYRDGVLTRLTEDHVFAQPEMSHVLIRAVGIESDLRLDVRSVQIEPYDRFLLVSDGVHGVLSDAALERLLSRRASSDSDAQAIVDAATTAGAGDNHTAVLVDVIAIGAVDQDMIGAEAARLPLLPLPSEGDNVDGFSLDHLLSDGRYTRLFVARDQLAEKGRDAQSNRRVLKFPKPALLSEQGARAAFLRESFIGRQVVSPYVGKTLELPQERQSGLYIVQPFYEGETLESRLKTDPIGVRVGVDVAIRLGKGVAALHRQSIAHRDIKPENVLLETDGGLKLLDLGVARLPRVAEFADEEIAGTPNYMAPELFAKEHRGDALSDQFAYGVTLYRMFANRYPFGEVDPFNLPRYARPTPLTQHRPDVPAWLDSVIMRSLAADPAERFDDMDALIYALEGGLNMRTLAPPEDLLLFERYPVRFWQAVSALLFIALIASLVLR